MTITIMIIVSTLKKEDVYVGTFQNGRYFSASCTRIFEIINSTRNRKSKSSEH
jgi:hypothetical protein